MKKISSLYFCVALCIFSIISCRTSYNNTSVSADRGNTPDSIYHIMKKVADWQIDSIRQKGWRHPEGDWTNGALYAGLLSFAQLSNDPSYYSFMKESVGEKLDWKLASGRNRYHADFYCVGQLYSRMYQLYKDPAMISDLELLADTLIARPHTESLEWKNNVGLREWAWCDALFMAPPSLAMLSNVTGEKKYMDLVDKLWWKTTDYLYDSTEHLYFRDGSFLHKKEKNGQKVFWSRGNGWVMGGLVRVLQSMPQDYPNRSRWVSLYQDMAAKIASIQQPDGMWRASLLDPASYDVKETSGTTFFCYALAWGINHGLLKGQKYTTAVWKAWQALIGCVHDDGMLGNVQRIGAAPGKVSSNDTEVYGVGAFLLAGSEVSKIAMESRAFRPDKIITNTSASPVTLGSLLKSAQGRYRNILTGESMSSVSTVSGGTTLYLQRVKES